MEDDLFLKSCAEGDIGKLRACLQEGVDINVKDRRTNRTGLMKALIFHENQAARLLLDQEELDIHHVDKFGCNVVHCAMIHGNKDGLEMLLAHGDITSNILNQMSKNGETPLMLAIAYNKPDCVKEMLADPRVKLDLRAGGKRTPQQMSRLNNNISSHIS